ncbi:MAG TPA: dethiobiotin synthase [Holophagaceae bacterium]|nr:dethiobiotin synthase [Holophagaceae bacterium]
MKLAELAGSLPSPLWVVGTDTGVGKTHVAAGIARAWAQAGPVTYRKPFQSGVASLEDADADARVVAGPGITVESHTVLRAPLSPLAAARAEGRELDLADALAWTRRPWEGRLVAEGVGGLMVPLWERHHFLSWATELKWPCVLVARGGLGTLNHSLLSAEALMLRGWRVEALVVNPGADGAWAAAPENAALLRELLPFPVHLLEPTP